MIAVRRGAAGMVISISSPPSRTGWPITRITRLDGLTRASSAPTMSSTTPGSRRS